MKWEQEARGELVCLRAVRRQYSAQRREELTAELVQAACAMSPEGMEATIRFMRGWRSPRSASGS